jgi:uncharacterized protein YjbI with pentapeptide repeats
MSSFQGKKLKKTVFTNCNLEGVDFTEADLSEAVFQNCDLKNAIFDRTQLEKADLSTAFNLQLDPERNRLKNAKFSMEGALELLSKYQIKIVG